VAELFGVTVDTTDVAELFAKFRRKGGNMAPIMEVAAELLVSEISDRYDSEGDGEWPPHAPATIRKTGEHQLMQLTGNLAGSTMPRHGKDFAEAATGVAYVRFHLEGGAVIPKRNPFEITDEAFSRVEEFIVDELADTLAKL